MAGVLDLDSGADGPSLERGTRSGSCYRRRGRRGPSGRRARVVAEDCDYFREYSIVIIFVSFLAPGGVPYISKV